MAANPGLRYTDIMILIRHRTHLHDLEQALREAGIPYLGNGKKTLLDTLEIRDMVALRILMAELVILVGYSRRW